MRGLLLSISMITAELLLVQRIRYDALELAAEGVGHEFLDVHDGHVVFAAEPMAFFAYLWFAKITIIAAWYFLSGAVVLPQAVFEKCLGETDFGEFAVGGHPYGYG